MLQWKKQGCLLFISQQNEITISLMSIKTLTNTGKNQKFIRKVREEVSTPFKPYLFGEKYFNDPFKVLSKLTGTSQYESI